MQTDIQLAFKRKWHTNAFMHKTHFDWNQQKQPTSSSYSFVEKRTEILCFPGCFCWKVIEIYFMLSTLMDRDKIREIRNLQ